MKHCISCLLVQTSRKLMIQLGGMSCIIFSLSWYLREIGKANKTVSE